MEANTTVSAEASSIVNPLWRRRRRRGGEEEEEEEGSKETSFIVLSGLCCSGHHNPASTVKSTPNTHTGRNIMVIKI